MTSEEYILKHCAHLPMALHIEIKKAFEVGFGERDARDAELIDKLGNEVEHLQNKFHAAGLSTLRQTTTGKICAFDSEARTIGIECDFMPCIAIGQKVTLIDTPETP